jgi:hypothetical protein
MCWKYCIELICEYVKVVGKVKYSFEEIAICCIYLIQSFIYPMIMVSTSD